MPNQDFASGSDFLSLTLTSSILRASCIAGIPYHLLHFPYPFPKRICFASFPSMIYRFTRYRATRMCQQRPRCYQLPTDIANSPILFGKFAARKPLAGFQIPAPARRKRALCLQSFNRSVMFSRTSNGLPSSLFVVSIMSSQLCRTWLSWYIGRMHVSYYMFVRFIT